MGKGEEEPCHIGFECIRIKSQFLKMISKYHFPLKEIRKMDNSRAGAEKVGT